MTKSWVSGGRSADLVTKLRQEISVFEQRRDELVERNKRKVFDWCSFVFNSRNSPRDLESLRNHPLSQEINEIAVSYEHLIQSIMDKQVLLNEKIDEQAKADSLG
jgi:hypothetical protein